MNCLRGFLTSGRCGTILPRRKRLKMPIQSVSVTVSHTASEGTAITNDSSTIAFFILLGNAPLAFMNKLAINLSTDGYLQQLVLHVADDPCLRAELQPLGDTHFALYRSID